MNDETWSTDWQDGFDAGYSGLPFGWCRKYSTLLQTSAVAPGPKCISLGRPDLNAPRHPRPPNRRAPIDLGAYHDPYFWRRCRGSNPKGTT